MRRRPCLLLNWIALGLWLALSWPDSTEAQSDELRALIASRSSQLESKLVSLRRDFHAHPELGNREQRTAALIAGQLRALGLQVRTGVARTGVIGVLKGALPGRVVALRSDMDGLPVKEVA